VKERLQKILARSGHGSRRSCEALIAAGRVRVNGVVVSELGAQADAELDHIEVDSVALEPAAPRVYLAMNKPPGAVTTARDPQGRRTVMELLPSGLPPHVLPVGRLDRDTEGLLIFTNDGEFAHRLAHPRYLVEKEYLALVQGELSARSLAHLRGGVEIEGRLTAPARVDPAPPPHGYSARDGHTWLRIVIHEGRKRQVRLMCAAVGHQVRTLVRVRIGSVRLGHLARSQTRPLAERELSALRSSLKLDHA
jgi:pseudouridine synthase